MNIARKVQFQSSPKYGSGSVQNTRIRNTLARDVANLRFSSSLRNIRKLKICLDSVKIFITVVAGGGLIQCHGSGFDILF